MLNDRDVAFVPGVLECADIPPAESDRSDKRIVKSLHHRNTGRLATATVPDQRNDPWVFLTNANRDTLERHDTGFLRVAEFHPFEAQFACDFVLGDGLEGVGVVVENGRLGIHDHCESFGCSG